MQYILTLNNINESDLNKVGQRALDIAKTFQSKYKTPLSFVVPYFVYEEFLNQTKLGLEIKIALRDLDEKNPESIKNTYLAIKELFSKAEIPEEFIDPLKEAYNSLAVNTEPGAAQDFLKEEEPRVNLIISPDYEVEQEDINGVLIHIKGFNQFLSGLKSCWLSLYNPESLMYRYKRGIKDFKAGIIVQKFVNADASAEAYSKGPLGDYEIIVKSYFGLPDILKNASKDTFSVSKELLKIESSRRGRQEYKIVLGEKGNLAKINLGEYGGSQKITDRDVSEIARLAKRMSGALGANFKAYYIIKKETPFFFLINRLPDSQLREIKQQSFDEIMPLNSEKTLSELVAVKDPEQILAEIEEEERKESGRQSGQQINQNFDRQSDQQSSRPIQDNNFQNQEYKTPEYRIQEPESQEFKKDDGDYIILSVKEPAEKEEEQQPSENYLDNSESQETSENPENPDIQATKEFKEDFLFELKGDEKQQKILIVENVETEIVEVKEETSPIIDKTSFHEKENKKFPNEPQEDQDYGGLFSIEDEEDDFIIQRDRKVEKKKNDKNEKNDGLIDWL